MKLDDVKIIPPLAPSTWHGEVLMQSLDDGTEQWFLKMYVAGALVLVPTERDAVYALSSAMHEARDAGDNWTASEVHYSRNSTGLVVTAGEWETLIV